MDFGKCFLIETRDKGCVRDGLLMYPRISVPFQLHDEETSSSIQTEYVETLLRGTSGVGGPLVVFRSHDEHVWSEHRGVCDEPFLKVGPFFQPGSRKSRWDRGCRVSPADREHVPWLSIHKSDARTSRDSCADYQ